MLKLVLAAGVACCLLNGCAGQRHDLVSEAKQMDAFVNAHDMDGFANLLADDVVVRGVDGTMYNGKDEVVKWLNTMKTGFNVVSSRWIQSGDTVTWMSVVHSDQFAKMGVDPMGVNATAVFAGDKLKYFGPMMNQQSANKMLFMQFYADVVNGGNIDGIDKYVAPDMVEHQPLPPGTPSGREGVKSYFKMIHEAFPDLHGTPTVVLGDGDFVLVYATWTGTNKGRFMGKAPTNKMISWNVADIVRIVDGKAVDHWGMDGMASAMMHPMKMK